MYKIRNKKTGLWSMGGVYEDFNSVGKVWKDLNGIKATLRIWTRGNGFAKCEIPKEWEIVEIVTVEKSKQSARDFFKKSIDK